MPILNNNYMTTQMSSVWNGDKRPGIIKAAIKDYFADAVFQETQSKKFFVPTHHVKMTVSIQEAWLEADETRSATRLTPLMQEIKHNPSISVNFSSLAKRLPSVFNAETLNEFAAHLVENGLVPEDVTVALSPYNGTGRSGGGALNLIFIFPVEVYGVESGEQPDARFTPVTVGDEDDEYSAIFASPDDRETEPAAASLTPPPVVKRNPLDLLR